MNNQKIFRYFMYAIGEILIVTIGIFIAIQLNNWNENRKTKDKIEGVFKEIKSNLQANQLKMKPLIQWYHERDSLIQLVKDKKLTYQDYEKNKDLLTLINFYNSMQIEKSGYVKLLDYVDDMATEYDSIVSELEILYGQIVPMNERYALVMENFNHRMHERWAVNYDWFSEPRDVSHKKERIEHFLKSTTYQNDVRLYSMYSKDNYVASLKMIYKISEQLLDRLEQH